MMLRSIVVATALVFTAVQAQAALITYDFEGTAETSGGALVVLAETEGSVTMTLTREAGVPFDIIDLSGFGGPASYGTRSLNPFTEAESATAFIADFSTLISSFTIDAGDFTISDIDMLLIEAYSGPNATGLLVDVFLSPPCCAIGGGFQGLTGGVAGANIASIRFIGGSNIAAHSMFYDNITINTIEQAAVPEPASLLLLGAGLVGGVRRWRKRRSDV